MNQSIHSTMLNMPHQTPIYQVFHENFFRYYTEDHRKSDQYSDLELSLILQNRQHEE